MTVYVGRLLTRLYGQPHRVPKKTQKPAGVSEGSCRFFGLISYGSVL